MTVVLGARLGLGERSSMRGRKISDVGTSLVDARAWWEEAQENACWKGRRSTGFVIYKSAISKAAHTTEKLPNIRR